MQKYVVLFFLSGAAPSLAQREEADLYGRVAYRNALYIDPNMPVENLEECVAVAGDVPLCYGRHYPKAIPLVDFHAGLLTDEPYVVTEGIEPDYVRPVASLNGQEDEEDDGAVTMPHPPEFFSREPNFEEPDFTGSGIAPQAVQIAGAPKAARARSPRQAAAWAKNA